MPFTLLHKIANTALIGLLMAAPLLRAQAAKDSPEITKLLTQAKANAALAADDADQLDAYTRSHLSWRSHSRQLETMRGHVNELIGDFNQLKALRSEGSAWQQDAIDRIDPLLKAMADHLTATIQHLNEHQNQIHLQPYQDYARGNRDLADKTLAVIRDFVDYGEALAEADSLEQKLNLASTPGDGAGA